MKIHDAFEIRMMLQVRQIQQYKKHLEQQGRKLSIDEAALEWINRYASDFSPLTQLN